MKVIDIVGENYFGEWDKTRTACRAIIFKDDKILLSYETKHDQWMLPGGGLEDGEDERGEGDGKVEEYFVYLWGLT